MHSDTIRSQFRYDSTFSITFQPLELGKCDENSSKFWEKKPGYLNEYTRLLDTSEYDVKMWHEIQTQLEYDLNTTLNTRSYILPKMTKTISVRNLKNPNINICK